MHLQLSIYRTKDPSNLGHPVTRRLSLCNTVVTIPIYVSLDFTPAEHNSPKLTSRTLDLLGIILLGSIENIIAAAVRRSSVALGFHIKQRETIGPEKVSETLKQVEQKYQLVSTSLLNIFFPGSMRISLDKLEELAFWLTVLHARSMENIHGIRLDQLSPMPLVENEYEGEYAVFRTS